MPDRPTPRTALATRILSRREVAGVLDLQACIDAVDAAFRAHATGAVIPSGVLGAPADGGGFHLKTAGLTLSRPYFAAKLNGNFEANAERFGLPRIQGLVILCDARNGYPLAVMDSIHITLVRTAAASAVAARRLSRPDSRVVTLCGCGVQGREQLAAIRRVRRIARAYLFDRDADAAARLAGELTDELEVDIVGAADLADAVRRSDICLTVTPARAPLFAADAVAPGTFVAAVGADSEDKQELDPELLRRARVVVDHLEQCATIGELHHALERGLLSRNDVHGELAAIVAEQRPGRTAPDEIFVFDSTGVALEDVAAAALVYERALAADLGKEIELLG